jgi:hypothetical protein
MNRPLMDKLLKEVGDLGDRMMLGLSHTVGGGVVNPGVATPSSPDNSQNSDEFEVNGVNTPDQEKLVEPEKTPYVPTIAGSQQDISIKNPDTNTNKAANPSMDIETGVNAIKYKVTPDEVITGINAELKDMVFKRPDVAKALVVKNLKKDPKYYSKLKFLNIDDSLDESFKYATPQEIAITKIMRGLAEKRRKK